MKGHPSSPTMSRHSPSESHQYVCHPSPVSQTESAQGPLVAGGLGFCQSGRTPAGEGRGECLISIVPTAGMNLNRDIIEKLPSFPLLRIAPLPPRAYGSTIMSDQYLHQNTGKGRTCTHCGKQHRPTTEECPLRLRKALDSISDLAIHGLHPETLALLRGQKALADHVRLKPLDNVTIRVLREQLGQAGVAWAKADYPDCLPDSPENSLTKIGGPRRDMKKRSA